MDYVNPRAAAVIVNTAPNPYLHNVHIKLLNVSVHSVPCDFRLYTCERVVLSGVAQKRMGCL